jgi:hypothetical protein
MATIDISKDGNAVKVTDASGVSTSYGGDDIKAVQSADGTFIIFYADGVRILPPLFLGGFTVQGGAPASMSAALATLNTFFKGSNSGSGGSGAVSSVAGRTGDVTLTASDVGLSNVSNTPAEQFVGVLYSKASFVSGDIGTDLINVSSGASASAGALAFTGGTNTLDKTLEYKQVSAYDRWRIDAQFTTGATSGTSYGFGIGKHSYNTSTPNGGICAYIDTTNGANAGKLYIAGGSAAMNAVVNSGSAVVAFTAGDVIMLSLERDGYVMTATARNFTTNTAPVIIVYQFTTNPIAEPLMDNTGRYAAYNLGGSFSMTFLGITSKVVKNATLMTIGDSKMAGYAVTGQDKRLADLLNRDYASTINSAGGNDRTTEVLARMTEMIALAPKQVLLCIGSNDVRASVAAATIYANYDSIASQLETAGIKVFHACFYEISADMSGLNTHINNTFAANRVFSSVFNDLKQTGAIHTDSIHLSDLGNQIIYNDIIKAALLSGGTEKHYTKAFSQLVTNTNSIEPLAPATALAIAPSGKPVAVGHSNTPSAFLDVSGGTTAMASLRLRSGFVPDTPNNGDMWLYSNHLYAFLNNVITQLDVDASNYFRITGANNVATSGSGIELYYIAPTGFIGVADRTGFTTRYLVINPGALTGAGLNGVTPTAFMDVAASVANNSGLRVRHGVAPTSPNDGDLWTTTTGLFARINGSTLQAARIDSAQTFSGIQTFAALSTLATGNGTGMQLYPQFTQTSTSTYAGLYMSLYDNGTNSGNKYLINLGTNTAALNAGTFTTKFNVTTAGAGTFASSITAGGSVSAAGLSSSSTLSISTTSTFTGVATFTAMDVHNGGININGKVRLKRTTVADAAYTTLATDEIVAYTTLTVTRAVTLVSGTAGDTLIIADESGNAGTFPITITGTVDGATNKSISTAYGVMRLYCITGTTYKTF